MGPQILPAAPIPVGPTNRPRSARSALHRMVFSARARLPPLRRAPPSHPASAAIRLTSGAAAHLPRLVSSLPRDITGDPAALRRVGSLCATPSSARALLPRCRRPPTCELVLHGTGALSLARNRAAPLLEPCSAARARRPLPCGCAAPCRARPYSAVRTRRPSSSSTSSSRIHLRRAPCTKEEETMTNRFHLSFSSEIGLRASIWGALLE